VARYAVIPGKSRVRADARSSLHPIQVETAGFEGTLEVDETPGQLRLLPGTRIELPVELLRSGNALVDGELQRKLDARKLPRIRGVLVEGGPLTSGRQSLTGDLTLHGVTRRLAADISLREVAPDTLEVSGDTTIDMRHFGLDPPRFLLFKVHPEVRIHVHLVAQLLR
jgi:polyisoprenoid-binding protein YceI